MIYRKRLAISELENGKVEVNAWTLSYIAMAVKKPITYFFPRWVKKDLERESLTDLEKELLIHFEEIWNDDLRKLAINLVKEIAIFDPRDMFIGVIIGKRNDEEIQEEIKKQEIIIKGEKLHET